jgi:formamidopyrimidine-DNA glycosylase
MPELPDITIYLEALERRVVGQPVEEFTLLSPFVLRSVEPAPADILGKRVVRLRRMGKRIVFEFEDDIFLVVHLMIAGRFRWLEGKKTKLPGRISLATLRFPTGVLVLTEAGTTRRASLHLVRGEDALSPFGRGGLEPLDAARDDFVARLVSESHTLKRALTDPRLFSGIGNAYSDEILHRARLSPLKLTRKLDEEELTRLYDATQFTLREWIRRLREETGNGFPEKVTAFREGMAVHGRFNEPCPDCGAPVQRIRYADNETNYCARCQTEGRLLADRALSRLLKEDWPRTLDD